MKNIIKKLIATALTAAMVLTALAIPASAAWKTTDNGVQWTDSTGKPVKSKWITMKNGNKYYINSKGYRVTGLITLTQNKVKNYYYFDSKGIMQTGWQLINNKYYYFQSSGKAVLNKKITIGSYSYKFDSKGVWDKKVINAKTKKDVTKSVDINKLTGISISNTSTKPTTTTSTSTADLKTPEDYVKSLGKIPAYVTICGTKVSTDVTDLYDNLVKESIVYKKWPNYYKTAAFVDLSNATDKDLENLKYLTKLENLYLESYEAISIADWVENNINITNLNFCRYMPKLKVIRIRNCSKLTDVSALQIFKTKFDAIGIQNTNNIDISTIEGVKTKYIGVVNISNADYWKLYTSVKATEIYMHSSVKVNGDAAYDNGMIGVELHKNYDGHTGWYLKAKPKRRVITATELLSLYPELRQAVENSGYYD